MSKKRKVNAPVSEQKRQQADERQKQLEKKAAKKVYEKGPKNYKPKTAAAAAGGKSGAKTNAKMFTAILGGVVLIAGAIGAAFYFAGGEGEPQTPWKDYQDRVKVTPMVDKTIREYVYHEREVPHWVAGARNPSVQKIEFEQIVTLAASWLAADDATKVILAAGAAHPEWGSAVAPHAERLIASTNDADPNSRDIKVRLTSLVSQFGAEAPAPDPEPEPAPEPTAEPAPES